MTLKRSNTPYAKLLRENASLRRQVTYETFMSQAKDEAQREWVNNRIAEINTKIRELNAKDKERMQKEVDDRFKKMK